MAYIKKGFNYEKSKGKPFSNGHIVPEKQRQIISSIMKGKPKSKEQKLKISLSKTGKKRPPFSEDWKNKLKIARKGRVYSEETKRKISIANKGKKKTPEHIAKMVASNTGKKHPPRTLECCKKISLRQLGEKNHNWRGGITPFNEKIRHSEQYQMWRKLVFTRDDFTCKECNKKGGYIQAHHIRPFAKHLEFRFDINNGITLCFNCHQKTKHKEYLFVQRYLEIINNNLTKL